MGADIIQLDDYRRVCLYCTLPLGKSDQHQLTHSDCAQAQRFEEKRILIAHLTDEEPA